MCYSIIEDCSPYYIRFNFDGLDKIIEFVKTLKPNLEIDVGGYLHQILHFNDSCNIINLLPMSKDIMIDVGRISIFNTRPGKRSGIHKDGNCDRVSLNIPLNILDEKCITTWYDDESFKDKNLFGLPYTRQVVYAKDDHSCSSAAKKMIAKSNEMILFNTDIYHSWDNTNSLNFRSALMMRVIKPMNFYFEDARKILFNY